MLDTRGKIILCEFRDCEQDATYIQEIRGEEVHLCETHEVEDHTGYCGVSCQLGYGCDQSC